MAPLSLRPARPEDGAGVSALFTAVHKRPLPEPLRRWRYDGKADAPSINTVALDGDRVVAHLGALRVELETPAGRRAAGLWADLMVHPEHRGLPLFLDMAEANMAACAQAGLSLLYAFPNDNSWPLLKRLLDWTDLGDLHAFEGGLPEPQSGGRALDGLPEAAELDAFWERVRAPGVVTLRRSGAWARWRYLDRPDSGYRSWQVRGTAGNLRGWAAAKTFAAKDSVIGDVLDLWTEDGEAEETLLSAVLAWFAERDVTTMSAWAAPGDQQASLWSSLALDPVGPVTHFGARALTPEAAAFASDPSLWRIAKGDSDVF
ncbi:MAG: GNAT family N-acetyltransferase [Elusimicrobia bacterium]|nr:GNAT family N-acetyltransferase [Elusimicrobiota bacterium]